MVKYAAIYFLLFPNNVLNVKLSVKRIFSTELLRIPAMFEAKFKRMLYLQEFYIKAKEEEKMF